MSTEQSELIARLKSVAEIGVTAELRDLARKSADALEALTSENARLTAHDQMLADANKEFLADCERLTAELGDLPEAQADLLAKCKELTSKLSALEGQEAAAQIHFNGGVSYASMLIPSKQVKEGDLLYLAAGAVQPDLEGVAECGNTPYDEGPFTLTQEPASEPAQEPNDDAFDALCREYEIAGTAEARLCREFWLAGMAPQARELLDDEIEAIWDSGDGSDGWPIPEQAIAFARAVLAARR